MHNSMMVAPKSKHSNESIKVCIRVRPLLPHEQLKEEIVYYPESKDPSLQVSNSEYTSLRQTNLK